MYNFWNTIIYYNSATWPIQIVITILGIVLTALLIRKPSRGIRLAMKIYMITLYSWVSIAYYLIYSDQRNHNDVMAIFWGVMALTWLWDATTKYTSFVRTHKYDAVAYLLLAMPIVYPLISLARGLSFPAMTSPIMPSSVVVFTLGILLLFARKVNMLLVLFLSHWTLIGLSKTLLFKIPEDFLMALATLPALYIFFRENFLHDLKVETKPKAIHINYLLIAVFVGLALLLIAGMCTSAVA
ncbi:MAG: DUF6064 family protein [Rikenellaceae bacterium]